MPGPVTPMSRARLAVRAIHRFKQAGQRQRNSQAAADAEGLGPVEEEEAQPSATTPLLEVRLPTAAYPSNLASTRGVASREPLAVRAVFLRTPSDTIT